MANRLERLIVALKTAVARGVWDGKQPNAYFRSCRQVDAKKGISVLFTRDTGYHTSGWWKNPDYERCLHLSLSVRDAVTQQPLPRERKLFQEIAEVFFGANARKAWIEGPYSPEGKQSDVWHYRVFCDPSWTPIMPRHEVYSREFTETGWKSFSEIHGVRLDEVDAPFLREGT